MPDQPATRIFISYSRKDGRDFAAELRKRLTAEGLSVWQDLVQMEGGQDWWSQIDKAIRDKDMEHFVLVVTPQALDADNGKIIRQEIRLARQNGKTVSPVRGPGIDDLGKLPRWFGHIYDIGIPEQFTRLIRVLQGPNTQKRVPSLAPEPPADFVARPTEFEALKQRLLDSKGDAVAITAALKGAGGYGKTTLARALAHDADVQDAYFDGILSVELGEKPANLLSVVSDLIEILTGERPGLENLNMAAAKLGEALGDRRILMVVDDAWRAQELRPFLQGGPNTTRLVTTRNDDVLPFDAYRQAVDAMRDSEALALLAGGLLPEQVAAQRRDLSKLAGRLGKWPLLLRLVNGFLCERIRGKEPFAIAIAGVNERLDAKGFTVFDAGNPLERTEAVAQTVGVGLDFLEENSRIKAAARARFTELAVFPEDADIPIGIVAWLWAQTGSLDKFDTEDLLSHLSRLSLLLGSDLDRRTFRLHDIIRHFLCDTVGQEGLVEQHRQLVGVLDSISAAPQAVDDLTQRYFYFNLPYHLAAAGERGRLDVLLTDPAWLKTKLEATRNPAALVADYEQYGEGELQNYIGRVLRLTSGICARDRLQMIPQFLDRIASCKAIGTAEFLTAVRRQLSQPAILTRYPSLTPPGAEIARLEGHTGWVRALCMLADGRLASASDDNTIRLWDLNTGVEVDRLQFNTGQITALCVLPDGRLAFGLHHSTIRLWDLNIGAETAILQRHTGPVTALCVLPDGRLASGSYDSTIRLWDLNTGYEAARLEGHTGPVFALCVLPDGRLTSGSYSPIISLWDPNTGVTGRLQGHPGPVTALCVLPDGRLASGSSDRTIRLWDLNTGTEAAILQGHTGQITALCPLPNDRLVSGSSDRTIRLWDFNTTDETARLRGHTGPVFVLCVLPDGRLASGSSDRTIRLWDLNTGAETAQLQGHTGQVAALGVLRDGRLASGSSDRTIRLWDLNTGAETARLQGHTGQVAALCVLRDGRLASGSSDCTIRLWYLKTGVETARLQLNTGPASPWTLEEHTEWVTTLCALPDGRLASGSPDRTIRLWDLNTGAETARLQGHTGPVAALCMLPDGRLASGSSNNTLGSSDRTIRLWDLNTGAETARLQGHTGSVAALCVLPDGRLASGSDDRTIRLWDANAGKEITTLETDAPILCLAALPSGGLVAGDRLGRLHWLEVMT